MGGHKLKSGVYLQGALQQQETQNKWGIKQGLHVFSVRLQEAIGAREVTFWYIFIQKLKKDAGWLPGPSC